MKRWVRPVVLAVVFVAAIIIGSLFMNKSNKDLTSSLQAATLPVIHFTYEGESINELHGYTKEMDACAMRDNITPISQDRMLHVTIDTFGTAVDSITYQIRSLDGQRLVAEGEVSSYQSSGNKITYDAQVENLLEDNCEYIYRIALMVGEKPVYYYMRIERAVNRNVSECLAFAKKFHTYTRNGEGSSFLPTYMDAATGDATTLNYVDLTCTLKQLTWADFQGDILTDVIADYKEINDTNNVIVLKYVIGSKAENGDSEFYNVEEYYRLRNTPNRMYVMNYERTMTQIFRGENNVLTGEGDLRLGIRSADVQYKANDAGNIIAFVQNGDLWCYNANVNNIAQVFSFRSVEGIDARENWNQHDIKIVRVDEAGSVTFIAYGYMNRGPHEGEVGVGVYRYDGLSHTIDEEIFIPSNKSYGVLSAEIGKLLYVNEMDNMYMVLGGNLYKIDLNQKNFEVLLENLRTDSYSVSESGRYFSYINADEINQATVITMMDLHDDSKKEIKADDNCYLRPLGFIDEDFIYGIANKDAVLTDQAGNISFAMDSLKIVSMTDDGIEERKEYRPASGYIADISIDDYIINVNLEQLVDGRYVTSGTDSIMNRNADKNENVLVKKSATEVKETEIILNLVNSKKKDVKMITSQPLVLEIDTRLEITPTYPNEQFYVYAKGNVYLMTDSVREAIASAYKNSGVVVDQKQSYVWNRARPTTVNPIRTFDIYETDKGSGSITCAVSAMLMREESGIAVNELVQSGTSVYSILHSTLKKATVYDLSGATLDQVLYYVGQGNPVFAMTGTDSAVLIVGYTTRIVYCYNPTTQTVESKSIDEATRMFEASANIFITYLK